MEEDVSVIESVIVISDEETEKCDTEDIGGCGSDSEAEQKLDRSENSSDSEVEAGDDATVCKKNDSIIKTVSCMYRNYCICAYSSTAQLDVAH